MNAMLLKKHNVTMLVQLVETIVDGSETMLRYFKGATRLNRRMPMSEFDHLHMYDKSGAFYLSAFLNKIIDGLPNK